MCGWWPNAHIIRQDRRRIPSPRVILIRWLTVPLSQMDGRALSGCPQPHVVITLQRRNRLERRSTFAATVTRRSASQPLEPLASPFGAVEDALVKHDERGLQLHRWADPKARRCCKDEVVVAANVLRGVLDGCARAESEPRWVWGNDRPATLVCPRNRETRGLPSPERTMDAAVPASIREGMRLPRGGWEGTRCSRGQHVRRATGSRSVGNHGTNALYH